MSEWTKNQPKEPGLYLMRDEGGGPTLYECIIKDGELLCGPKVRTNRIQVDAFWTLTTEWKKVE